MFRIGRSALQVEMPRLYVAGGGGNALADRTRRDQAAEMTLFLEWVMLKA